MKGGRSLGLAALIVNYNTGAFAVGCARSLIEEWEGAGRPREKLQLVVVDNASPQDQSEALAELESMGAIVIRHDQNSGYATGMNLAYARTTGAPDDLVAVLNPDIYFLPGSVETMIEYMLDHPRCGALDPRACMDPLGTFNLPRNLLPTVAEYVRVGLAQLHPAFARAYSRRRLRFAYEWWSATEPLEADMLSGCCLFMHRRIVDEMPSLMDERYPLYYEDTDLFRTLQQMGYSVVHHGGARIIHHWSRSAGAGGEAMDEPTRRHDIGKREYFRKFTGTWGSLVVRAMDWVIKRWPKDRLAPPIHDFEPLGYLHDPVEIRFPRECDYLVEFGVAQTYIIAAGVLGHGDHWRCPDEAWDWLPKMRFYLRAIDRRDNSVMGAWVVDKATNGRSTAMDAAELASYGERLWLAG